MSNPNTPEGSSRTSPRGLTGVDARGGDDRIRRTQRSEKVTDKHKSKTASRKDSPKAQKPARIAANQRPKLRKSAELASPSDLLYVSKTHATIKTRLADELGCEAGDIGDIRPRTLYRLLSSESTDEDPLHILRLQQAIIGADKAIQDQSWFSGPEMLEGSNTPRLSKSSVKADRGSTAKKSCKKSESKSENKTKKKQGSKSSTPKSNKKGENTNIKQSVHTPKGSRTDMREAYDVYESVDQDTSNNGTPCSVGAPSVGTPMDSIGTPSVGTPSVCSVTSGLEELIEGLQDLDYPDWYNEECDAEVASLELGNRGDQETRDPQEDEELKLFEELEAKLADETDVMKTNTVETLSSSLTGKDRTQTGADEEDVIKKTTTEPLDSCQAALDKNHGLAESTDEQDELGKTTQQALAHCMDTDTDWKDESIVTDTENDILFVDPLSPILEEVNEDADKTKKVSLDDIEKDDRNNSQGFPINVTNINEVKKAGSVQHSDTEAPLDTLLETETKPLRNVDVESSDDTEKYLPNAFASNDEVKVEFLNLESECTNTSQSQMLICDIGSEHSTAESHAEKAIDVHSAIDNNGEKRNDGVTADRNNEHHEAVGSVGEQAGDKTSTTMPTQETSDHFDCLDIEPEHSGQSTTWESEGSETTHHSVTMQGDQSSLSKQYAPSSSDTAIPDTQIQGRESQLQSITQSTLESTSENTEKQPSDCRPYECELPSLDAAENESDHIKTVQEESQNVHDCAFSQVKSGVEIETPSVQHATSENEDIQKELVDVFPCIFHDEDEDEPVDGSALSNQERPGSRSPLFKSPNGVSQDVMSPEIESLFETQECKVQHEIKSLHSQQTQSDFMSEDATVNESHSTEGGPQGIASTGTSAVDTPPLNSSIENEPQSVDYTESESFTTPPPESESLCTSQPADESLSTSQPDDESLYKDPFESESFCTDQPESKSPCTSKPDDESLTTTPNESESLFTTPPESESPFDTPPCMTPPESASPCLTPPEGISPCITPPEGTSPCVTPPVDCCPSMDYDASTGTEDNPGSFDEGKESVTRRSKKGRSSPANRASVPVPTEMSTPDVKSKTESCVVC